MDTFECWIAHKRMNKNSVCWENDNTERKTGHNILFPINLNKTYHVHTNVYADHASHENVYFRRYWPKWIDHRQSHNIKHNEIALPNKLKVNIAVLQRFSIQVNIQIFRVTFADRHVFTIIWIITTRYCNFVRDCWNYIVESSITMKTINTK